MGRKKNLAKKRQAAKQAVVRTVSLKREPYEHLVLKLFVQTYIPEKWMHMYFESVDDDDSDDDYMPPQPKHIPRPAAHKFAAPKGAPVGGKKAPLMLTIESDNEDDEDSDEEEKKDNGA